ncbi:ferritin-like domain-containing protein [Erythrobacter sp. HA6-11]
MTNLSTFKDLTQTTHDSVRGYQNAIEKAEDPQLKQALQERCEQRHESLQTMNSTLRQFGEEPVTSESMSGSAHQTFMSIADAFESGNEAAAERVEEGEDYLAGQFRDALEDDDLNSSVRQTVQQVYAEIQAGESFGDRISQQYDS